MRIFTPVTDRQTVCGAVCYARFGSFKVIILICVIPGRKELYRKMRARYLNVLKHQYRAH